MAHSGEWISNFSFNNPQQKTLGLPGVFCYNLER